MNNSTPVFINSKVTGGHYAMRTERASKPFENNMRECMSISLKPNDIVADIGAYVGEYSIYAAKHGVRKVLCYEPTPYTFNILEMNAISNMKLFNLAVVGDDSEYINLYISKGIGVTNSIVKSFRKAGVIKVEAIKYEDAVRNATVVKIDVEGAEYSYNIIQPKIRAIILEFHPITRKPWKKWAYKIMSDIEDAGFKSIIRPTFKSGWSLTGSWSR
jgi:FkbM family methyltransferase